MALTFEFKGFNGSPRNLANRPDVIIVDDLESEESERRIEKFKKNIPEWFAYYFPHLEKAFQINTESWENRKLGIYCRYGRK